MASSFPSKVKREVVSLTGPAPRPAAVQEPVSVPEFVSLVNLSEFLLAAEDNAAVSPRAREAAEALSAKFAGPLPSAASDTEFLHAVVQRDSVTPNVLEASLDSKKLPRIAALSESQAVRDPDPGPAQKVVEIAKVEATVEPPKEAAIKPVVRPMARGQRQTRHTQPKSTKISLATRQTRAKSAKVSSWRINGGNAPGRFRQAPTRQALQRLQSLTGWSAFSGYRRTQDFRIEQR